MRLRWLGAAALAVSLAGGLQAWGQPPPRPGGSDGGQRPQVRRDLLDRIINEVGLSDEQLTQVKALDVKRQERLRVAGDDADQRREALTWFQGEVRKLLTPEQWPKFDALLPRRHDGRSDFAGPLAGRLGLSAPQVEKIKALAPALKEKLDAAAGDSVKRREAWDWYQTQVRAILTDEQRARYDEQIRNLRERVDVQGLLRVDWAMRGLELTPEQIRRVEELRVRRDRRMKEAFDAFQEALKGVLTAEQMETLERRLKQTPRLRPPGPQRPGPPGPGRPRGPERETP